MIALEELKKLPLAERLQLVEDQWDSTAEDKAELPDDPSVIAEAMARDEASEADPSSSIPWNIAKEQIRTGRA
jgi:putative addiction module component (TIGR02574 family)